MPTIITCMNKECKFNPRGCYCEYYDGWNTIRIGSKGECVTFKEKDIYAEAEVFKRFEN